MSIKTERLLSRAKKLLVKGKIREAESIYLDILSSSPKNKEAKDSMLYVCIDGPRNTKYKRSQDQMCDHVEIIRTQFLNIKIIKQNSNIGLAKHMIQNVTNIVNKHD